MLAVSKEVFFPTKETLSLAKEKNNLKRPPNENSGRKCRALRSLIPMESDFNVPGLDDDKVVFCHDPHKYVSDEDIPDQDNYFSTVEEKIDRELASKKNKRKIAILLKDGGFPLIAGEMEKTLPFIHYPDSVDMLEEQMGSMPHIASFHKFPSHIRKRRFGG